MANRLARFSTPVVNQAMEKPVENLENTLLNSGFTRFDQKMTSVRKVLDSWCTSPLQRHSTGALSTPIVGSLGATLWTSAKTLWVTAACMTLRNN
ncbi:hypothetical protein [Oleiagrimonas sp. C23AA]|uniref:hypothetical protein n=1 Tax=Oleiagrimonas sp. C23AA TaxID=2719047 RepID=UPI001422DFC3|nr:hypothetical protein [Oleiagrimonas sp. C23AA]NII11968.1 hypothetical protein [Oleiagrimonas sp. C23AA]